MGQGAMAHRLVVLVSQRENEHIELNIFNMLQNLFIWYNGRRQFCSKEVPRVQ